MSSSIPIGPHVAALSRVTWLAASRRPLKPNERRRRCAPLLNSQIPLVHGTKTTDAGRVGAKAETAAQRKLICSLTDGSPSHTQPPNHQPASHQGARQVGEDDCHWIWNVRQLDTSQAWRKILLPLASCGVFGALVYYHHPAASSQSWETHIRASQGVTVINMCLRPEGSYSTITFPYCLLFRLSIVYFIESV